MKTFVLTITLVGALGLFMYGMKVMSEALQKVAGPGLRKNLALITGSRLKGIITGTVITAAIQSSSATTIMVVSFVNAGLLTLFESTSLIIGANIGTTFTAWLVSLLGFKFNISVITLPLIGISMPFYFSKKKYVKYWGEFIIGFALIFIGLDFIKNIFPDIQNSPDIFGFVSGLTSYGFGSILIFLFIGFIITAMIQSSSVASTLTLVMCFKGWINIEHAAAMILGENIGTTITANIAAIIANKTGKRAAFFHFLFNFLGMIWALPLLKPMLFVIDKTIIYFSHISPFIDVNSVPVALAAFHTSFNIINTCVYIWFVPQFVKITEKIFKVRGTEQEKFGLKFLYRGFMSTSELSIFQVRNGLIQFGKRTYKMYQSMQKLFFEINQAEFKRLFLEIKECKIYNDNLEEEARHYLMRLSEGELSHESYFTYRITLKLIEELNKICNSIYNIARILRRKRKNNIWFTQDIRNNLNQMFHLLQKAFKEMNSNLNKEFDQVDSSVAFAIEKEINKYRKLLLKTDLNTKDDREYKYEAGIIYNDLFNRCERLGDYIYNISKTIGDVRKMKEV